MVISKELFSAVKGIPIGKLHNLADELNGKELEYEYDTAHGCLQSSINIYELVHRYCKEWAYNNFECVIESSVDLARVWTRMMCGDDEGILFSLKDGEDSTISACQWLLDNK